MTDVDVKSSQSGCIFVLASILLGFVLTLGSILYQREVDPTCHSGGLTAGFPLGFICDDSGGSPISSWGRIDLADVVNVRPRVFLLDFLLWSAVVSLAWVILMSFSRKGLAQNESFRWVILLCLGYIVAFLFAFVLFQSSYLDFEVPEPRTPTPIIFTSTPFGTPPFPAAPPSATYEVLTPIP